MSCLPELLKELARVEPEKIQYQVFYDDTQIRWGLKSAFKSIKDLTSDDCDAILKQIGIRIMLTWDSGTKTLWAKTMSLEWTTETLYCDTHETEKLPATLEGTRWAIENYLKKYAKR